MANQPTPARPWFRLTSIARPAPAPAPTPAPEPAPVQVRPPLIRPTFRPIGQPQPQPQPTQPTQPQEPTPPAPTVAAPAPTPASTNGVASVPTSPIQRASAPTASLPTTPAPKTSVSPTVVTTTTSSVPPSPKPNALSTSSSVPSPPASKAAPSTSSVPTYSAPKPVPTSTSVTTSPVSRAPITTAAVPATMTRVTSPIPSPKPIKPMAQTPPASPKPRPTAPPPSPLILPPSQIKSDADHEPKIPLEAEQKTVLVQKTIDKPKAWFNGSDTQIKPGIAHNVKKEMSKDVETKEKGHHKKLSSDSEEGGMRVITIAGENKGASMEVIQSPKKHGFVGNPHSLHRKENFKMNEGNELHSHSSSSGEEGSSKMKDKSHQAKEMPSLPMSAFMNSNVQGVNNSIMYNSSCTHHDPGVHVAFSRKPDGGFHVKDLGNGHH